MAKSCIACSKNIGLLDVRIPLLGTDDLVLCSELLLGIFMFNKGKEEILFWVQAKRELGVEDAMYCIKNISKYTLMKNAGIILICVGIIAAISFAIYKFSSRNEESDKA